MLAICIPSGDEVKTGFVMSLVALLGWLQRAGTKFRLVNVRSSDIAVSRNQSVKQALELGATEILWIDTDMVFQADIYDKLKAHDKSIVGCTYRKRDGTLGLAHAEHPTEPDHADLAKVGALPGGMLLVQADVYVALGFPYYGRLPMRDSMNSRGEDYSFCIQARRLGYETYLDRQASTEIGHIAETGLFIDTLEQTRA